MNLDDLLIHAGSKVHIKAPAKLKQTLQDYCFDGADFLQILTDFDRTLTKHSSNGIVTPSTHAVLENSGLFSDEYRDKATVLRDKYYPLEMDPTIDREKKEKLMVEWWSEGHRLLLLEKIKKTEVQCAVRESRMEFRKGFERFRRVLCAHEVPTLVFSAGIGTIVKEVFLQKSSHRLESLQIVSNFLHFNEQGITVGFEGPLIHTFNKGRFSHLNKEYFARTAKRKNVILLGDTLGDVEMGNNLDESKFNVLKIGFLNDKVEQNRAFYLKVYDIVIEDPENMEYVFELICAILNVGEDEKSRLNESFSIPSESSPKTVVDLSSRALTCPSAVDAEEHGNIVGNVTVSPAGSLVLSSAQ